MAKKRFAVLLIALLVTVGVVPGSRAQEVSTQQQEAAEKQEKEKEAEAKAIALLEQVVAESSLLKLPENRVRVQIVAADLFWSRNKERARALFDGAAAGVNEMIATAKRQSQNQPQEQRGPRGGMFFEQDRAQNRAAAQLRQELVLTAARHDATLATQLLQATQQASMPTDPQIAGRPDPDANLEQRLMAQIARTDPLQALKSAEEYLDKGQYPNSLAQVLTQLQAKDKDAAAKLSDRVFKKLQTENLLAKQDAGNLALNLLRPGPRPSDSPTDGAKTTTVNPSQVLSETTFRDLMDTVIAAAMKATPPTPGTERGQNNMRGGQGNGPANRRNNAGTNPQPPTSLQLEQNAARMLLMGLQSLLPQIDKYLPARAGAVRQKLTQMGVDSQRLNQISANQQLGELMRQGTSESLLAAASTAPNNMRPSIYQQAAMKALDEGNADRARQIATQHLSGSQRTTVLQMADMRQLAQKSGDEAIEGVKQALASLPSDDERVRMVLQLASATQTANPKLALQILEEGQRIVSGRATSYRQFDNQIQVARAFATLDTGRSFEVLEPGINQLNELLSAAALLSGFEVNVFRDGELPIQGGSRLTSTVSQYAEALAGLARSDFERAQAMADRFQLVEARILAKMTIARSLLGAQLVAGGENNFGNRPFGPNAPFMRREE